MQVQDIDWEKVEENSLTFRQKLVGTDDNGEVQHVISPYTQRYVRYCKSSYYRILIGKLRFNSHNTSVDKREMILM